jgi:hypothetical protein
LVGLSEQILHVGSYNNDSKSFEEMKEFVMKTSLKELLCSIKKFILQMQERLRQQIKNSFEV